MTLRRLAQAATSSSRMMRSLLRKPMTTSTSQPWSCSHLACGYAMAVPRPPPMTHARFEPSSSVGLPSGPTKSSSASPALSVASRIVVAPTAWNTMVTVPACGSAALMVSGMRSPCSSMRSMMNWPGLILRAISGARTTMRVTSALSASTLTMGYIAIPLRSNLARAPALHPDARHRENPAASV